MIPVLFYTGKRSPYPYSTRWLDEFDDPAVAEADDAVGAVVLTGAGGAFCAGGDVKGFAERSPGAPEASKERLQRANQRATSGRLWRMPKPTIAVLPGAAAGAE